MKKKRKMKKNEKILIACILPAAIIFFICVMTIGRTECIKTINKKYGTNFTGAFEALDYKEKMEKAAEKESKEKAEQQKEDEKKAKEEKERLEKEQKEKEEQAQKEEKEAKDKALLEKYETEEFEESVIKIFVEENKGNLNFGKEDLKHLRRADDWSEGHRYTCDVKDLDGITLIFYMNKDNNLKTVKMQTVKGVQDIYKAEE